MLGEKLEIVVDSVIKDKGLINFRLNKGEKNGNSKQEGEV